MAAGRTHFANKRTMKPGEDLSKGHDEDGAASGSRGVEEPAASIEGNAVPHAGSVNVNLVGDLDIGLNFGCGLEARPCRNLSPLSGLASNGVEKVVGSNSAVKLDPKAHASGDANRQYKSWDEQINEKVSVGYSNARDTIEEENSEDEPGGGKENEWLVP
ncbi:hypothetical protein V6N12_063655 [Hibiscus sabdariffa]|uniref:Uncharacterized protein n=1 Tax=Hibiscus sabdariffa TaxID=183260 RepID=A0ABR2FCF3_9ROSI